MRFFINRDPTVYDTCIMYVVNYGSINDIHTEGAHLLEHVIAEGGTRSKTYEDILTQVRDFKEFNAETTDDYTVFYALVGRRNLGRAMEFLSDIINCSIIPESSVGRERKRVICELLEAMDEIPQRMDETICRSMFGSEAFDTFEQRLDSVKAITARQLRNIYNDFFVQENSMIVVNSGMKQAEIMDMINMYTNLEGGSRSLSHTPHRNRTVYLENHTENDILVEVNGMNSSRIGLGISLPGALRFNRPHDYVAIELLDKIISEHICERGILSGVYMYSHDISTLIRKDSSSIVIQTATNPERLDIENVKQVIVDEIRKVSDGAINREEIERHKRELKREIREFDCDVYNNVNYAFMMSGSRKDHADMVSDISIRSLKDFARGIDPDRLASVIFVPKKSTNIRSE